MAQQTTPHIIAIPYPGRGHINPMLVLSNRLAVAGAIVTFVITEEWLSLLSTTASLTPHSNLNFRTIPNVIPSEVERANDFEGFLDAVYTKMEAPFEELLDRLDGPKPVLFVADMYLPWALDVGNRRGVPVASLFTNSATFSAVFYHFEKLPLRSGATVNDNELLEHYVPALSSLKLADAKNVVSNERTLKRALEAFTCIRKSQFLLFTSFYELEAGIIDSLRSEVSCPVYPVGPCIPYMMLQEKTKKPLSLNGSNTDYIEWLDNQPKNSVLYVSLGSFLSVSNTQMEEIAAGLHASETRFLWILRGDTMKMQKMCGGIGLVIPWCDQLRVLCHPSVGGFLTHCGWNSILESLFAGVPMLTLPIIWDQPINSRLVVNKWKIGFSLKEKMGNDNVVRREDIVLSINKLMNLDDSESMTMRKRAKEYRMASRKVIGKGGSSDANLNHFLSSVVQGASDD